MALTHTLINVLIFSYNSFRFKLVFDIAKISNSAETTNSMAHGFAFFVCVNVCTAHFFRKTTPFLLFFSYICINKTKRTTQP